MNNFDFCNPTRIIFGRETVSQLNDVVPADAKVMILFGGSSAEKTGTLDEVRASLGDRAVSEFGGIEPNPTYETLMKAVELIRSKDIDYLLAVGGGSVIDGTKFVAAAVPYEGEPWDILLTGGQHIKSALPFGTVLTLPATGSEMNSGSVVTRRATNDKLPFMHPLVFPKFSILDPTKVYTLPERQVANGVADAFVHVIEQYLTFPQNAMVQDRLAEGLLQTLVGIGPKILADQKNYDLSANLMWSASVALGGMVGTGVRHDWATHMIGHELTALYNIDHARTLAIVLPSLLNVQRKDKAEKLLQFGERVWNITEGTEEARIDQTIDATRNFFESLGISTRLSGYDLGEEVIDAVVKQLEKHGMVTLGEHGNITPDVSRRILVDAL
ncbi:iron-containing alcohol dehydrogenase [Leucothrix arctica]|uniref:NADH-dependent alcohol dehydrogenase n=1 Tax=Leucothrix arctica TaxID=1481894 RepID=A0A317C5R8_9GAMM|nr:iron-containing alcohol dehydrogenase [Leucothrix arctica]PWQ93561.1 NADH-dependent alcohol dehydrogenase [Leucothrix arctica]